MGGDERPRALSNQYANPRVVRNRLKTKQLISARRARGRFAMVQCRRVTL